MEIIQARSGIWCVMYRVDSTKRRTWKGKISKEQLPCFLDETQHEREYRPGGLKAEMVKSKLRRNIYL